MRTRSFVSQSVIFSAVLLLAANCRRDEPPPPPSAPAPNAIAPQAAPVPFRKTSSETPAPNTSPSAPINNSTRTGAKDASGPSYLPRGGDISGWTPRDPMVVVSPADLGKLMTAEHARRLARFNLRSAAACGYQMRLANRDLVANILAIETAAPEDAYGLVTCSCSSPQADRCGGLTRVDPGPPVRFHTWQGRVALAASINAAGTEEVAELRRLVQHIVSRIQRE